MRGFQVPAVVSVADTLIIDGLLAQGTAIGKLICQTLDAGI
jgi:hypothetical protein